MIFPETAVCMVLTPGLDVHKGDFLKKFVVSLVKGFLLLDSVSYMRRVSDSV